MDMILNQLREKIEKEEVPAIDVRDEVMSQIENDGARSFFVRKRFKFVFTCFLVFLIFISLLQGVILLNDSFLGFLNNAEKGNIFVKVVQTIKLDKLAANIKELNLLTEIKSILINIFYYLQDIYYYIKDLLMG